MEKNPKACEPCRRRKVRCDGQTPCSRCKDKPAECTYRLRTRVRKSGIHRAATAASRAAVTSPGGRQDDVGSEGLPQSSLPPALPSRTTDPSVLSPSQGRSKRGPEDAGPKSDSAYSNVYQSVTAAHELGSGWTENSRLFYGPASQFAFLQQVHRGLISSASPHGQQDREVQEGGPGLDLFLQRSFFFGTASRVDISSILRPAASVFPEVPLQQAEIFLEKFKAWTARHLPLFTDDELDKMLENLYLRVYGGDEIHSRPSQTKALTLAVLAVGALATPHTDTAEILLARANYESVLFSDTVSLQMIQFSLLLAEYHMGMGRPNLVYLSIGTACRKAFALGLHRESANSLTRSEDVQKYRKTLWSLYAMEGWYAMMVGRESSLKMADISSPFPEDQPLLGGLSRLAEIAERTSHMIYTQRYDSLRKLYAAAETIHAQLRDFADKHGIGSALLENTSREADVAQNPTSLILHNLYYHTILLTYRPFLVADCALASTPESQGGGAMWLRQACRTAIDAAQDGILYAHTQIKKHDCCRTSRFNGFFFESNCAVLFFDILRHPSKYPYNVEYVHMALQSLDSMINDEPITNARNSIRQILRVVEDTISKKRLAGSSSSTTPAEPPPADSSVLAGVQHTTTGGNASVLPSPASFLNHDQQQGNPATSRVHFPSLNAPAQQLIYFPDLGGGGGGGGENNNGGAANSLTMSGLANDPVGGGIEGLDPLLHSHYDVLATDLFSFFPLNMTPPSAAGNDAGVLGGENGHVS